MLRLILTILKITGILLLVIVFLLLVFLLTLVFVPIRYRLQVVYTCRKMGGELRITWLLHLLSVRLSVAEQPSDKDTEDTAEKETEPLNARLSKIRTSYEIRILGINLASVLVFLRRLRASKKDRGTVEGGRGDRKRVRRRMNLENGETLGSKAESEDAKQDTAQTNKVKEAKQRTTQVNEAKEAKQSSGWREVPDHNFSRDKAPHGARQSFSRDTEDVEINEKKSGNLLYKLSEFCDTIKKIPSRLKQCYRQFKKILQKPGQIQKRFSKFVRKLEKYQASEVLAEVWHEIGHLLHHYRVRKGSGYLRFGTGDPALTGEITGVLYMILPAQCGDISIEPQFTETVFETELWVSGHIRIVHLIRTAWWGFRNRKMRRLIRAFRK